MTQTDRRRTERFTMEIPVSIRRVEMPEAHAHSGVSSNISASGLFLSTDLQLNVGAPVEIALKMPAQVTGKTSRNWRCMGRVVRVEANEVRNAKGRVGVQFHYYEVMDGPGGRLQI